MHSKSSARRFRQLSRYSCRLFVHIPSNNIKSFTFLLFYRDPNFSSPHNSPLVRRDGMRRRWSRCFRCSPQNHLLAARPIRALFVEARLCAVRFASGVGQVLCPRLAEASVELVTVHHDASSSLFRPRACPCDRSCTLEYPGRSPAPRPRSVTVLSTRCSVILVVGKLEDAAKYGFQRGCACRNDTELELQTVRVLSARKLEEAVGWCG